MGDRERKGQGEVVVGCVSAAVRVVCRQTVCRQWHGTGVVVDRDKRGEGFQEQTWDTLQLPGENLWVIWGNFEGQT